MADYDLLIAGNGFDLACGYKTSYPDFLEHKGGKVITNPLISFFLSAYRKDFIANAEWNGFENLLCQYLQFLDYSFKNEANVEWWFSEPKYDFQRGDIRLYFYWKIKDVSKLPNNVFTVLCLENPLDRFVRISSVKDFKLPFAGLDASPNIKEVFFETYVCCNQACATKRYALSLILKELDRRLSELEAELAKYISGVTQGKADGPIALQDSKAKLLISFNYSNTAQKAFGIQDSDAAYIHGSTAKDAVLGVEPLMILGQTFDEESDFIKFFKRFRRIYKNCNANYHDKIAKKLTGESLVAIYGHSLDLSDKSILAPIFASKYKRYDIYCYGDIEEYKLKLAKLLGLNLFEELVQDDRVRFVPIGS